MEETNRIAKIVGTPNETSWTQALVIDGFCALLSIEKEPPKNGAGEASIGKEGKEILVSLEEEYHQKKVKTLQALKELFSQVLAKRKVEATISFVAAEMVGRTVYLVLSGKGKVILRRKDEMGVILQPGELVGSCGILQQGDLVVLQVGKFQDLVSDERLAELLQSDLFDEIAENMALLIHGQDEAGGAGAILITIPQLSLARLPKLAITITRKKGITLALLAILTLILAGSILFALNQKKQEENRASFQTIYQDASKKYEEGTALLALNKELARGPLSSAENLLTGVITKAPADQKKKEELLSEINEALREALNIYSINEAPVFFDLPIIRTDIQAHSMALSSSALSILDKKQNVVYTILLSNKSYSVSSASLTNPRLIAAGEETVFALDEAGIWQDKNLVIKKEELGEMVALVAFAKNVYALDKKNQQILKFVPVEEGRFGRKNYFSDALKLDFSEAISMTIDGSIFVMFSDGTIRKYLEGRIDNFVLSGIDTPLREPTSIFTNKDQDFLYVLDQGNRRVVVLKKNGGYEAQYIWEGIKDVSSFAVSEADKKIFLLLGNKIYSLDLK